MKQTHESKPVNPSIAKAFFWIRYAEEVGTGTNKIILWCEEWGLPEPEFQCAGSSLVVVLRKSKLTEDYLKGLNFTDRQMRALEHLKTNPKITSGEYAKLFTVTDRTARNDLMKLVAKGIVKKVGTSDKNAHYILAEIYRKFSGSDFRDEYRHLGAIKDNFLSYAFQPQYIPPRK